MGDNRQLLKNSRTILVKPCKKYLPRKESLYREGWRVKGGLCLSPQDGTPPQSAAEIHCCAFPLPLAEHPGEVGRRGQGRRWPGVSGIRWYHDRKPEGARGGGGVDVQLDSGNTGRTRCARPSARPSSCWLSAPRCSFHQEAALRRIVLWRRGKSLGRHASGPALGTDDCGGRKCTTRLST